ncbi:DUF6928 family protein [Streptomyces massasporeus]
MSRLRCQRMALHCVRHRGQCLGAAAAGAKAGLLVYADGDVPGALRRVGAADLDRTVTLMRRLHPGRQIEECEGSTLWDGL